jgi:transcriptional regulator with XRE-family HTH domain
MTTSERADFFIEGMELLAKPYHYLASGLDNIFLLNGWSEKVTDYGPMLHIENINGLHRAIGLHIVEKTEAMKGSEFRFLRKQMSLSQLELANHLGVSDQTIANYEKGKTGLGPADPFMRTCYLLHILPEQTRLEVIKSMTESPVLKVKKKLPEVPRRTIVEHWREEPQLMAA